MKRNDPDLVWLILGAESMPDYGNNNDDRQHWFDLHSAMDVNQRAKLKDILMREKVHLTNIDCKYQKNWESLQ